MDLELQSCSCVWKSLKCQIDIGKKSIRNIRAERPDTDEITYGGCKQWRHLLLSKIETNWKLLNFDYFFFRVEFFLIILPKNFAFQKGKKIVKMFKLQKKLKKNTSKKKLDKK